MIFTFLIFLADFIKFFSDSLSETIRTFDNLFNLKNLLNSLVFLTSFLTSDRIKSCLSLFFFDKV